MGQILAQVLSFLIGLFSSWVFWYLLIRIKPKVDISPVATFNSNKGTISVKVINKGKRQITDLNTSMFVAERKSETTFAAIHEIKMRYDSIMALSPNNSKKVWWHSPFTGIFMTDEGKEIMDILSQKDETSENQRKIIFILSATDDLSGSKVVFRNAYGVKDIRRGRFAKGNSFMVQDFEKDTEEKEMQSNPNAT